MDIVLIEDESLNAEQLLFYISKYDPSIVVKAILKSNKEIIEWFAVNPAPSLAFCDINLLDGNIFSSLHHNIITCPIIFTTAFDNFYQEAFDSNGIAYLLKPISFRSFESAMDKFNRLTPASAPVDWLTISSVIKKLSVHYKERIPVKINMNTILLEVKTIMYVSTNLGICKATDHKGKTYEFRQKFSELVESLNPDIFFQINRGEIVNINFIELIEPYFNDRLSIKITNHPGRLITSVASTPGFRKWIDR
ncbi:LytTR family DNA-binding domain-containing protein [Chryseobacterium sp.]|uniref:LytR/AlgR family response regulator transcription factor n=1 Tax=Chryseobacterium sp. TaxID=1871047 RepID=UPI00334142D0